MTRARPRSRLRGFEMLLRREAAASVAEFRACEAAGDSVGTWLGRGALGEVVDGLRRVRLERASLPRRSPPAGGPRENDNG